ncbi:MAG TPA: ABC transporter permease, partial [Steroidobacteraceae bacterium]|nr:ABC transporter permease [Steroidobacteraceae bacterium]
MIAARIIAVAYKEWREIVRDRLFFALAFILPATLMLLFGYGLSLDVEHLPLAVIDYDHSPLSREYSHRFTDSRYFDLKASLSNERSLARLITTSRLRAALIIPADFEKNLLAGRKAEVQTLIDGTFPFRAQTAKGYVTAINAAFNVDTLSFALSQQGGLPEAAVREQLPPIRIEVRYLYNQGVKSIWSL